MTKKTILVTMEIEVTINKSKFTPEFMSEFRESFYPFETIDEHIEHLAQMHARGIYDDHSFIEGYGYAKDMGIKFEHHSTETEVA